LVSPPPRAPPGPFPGGRPAPPRCFRRLRFFPALYAPPRLFGFVSCTVFGDRFFFKTAGRPLPAKGRATKARLFFAPQGLGVFCCLRCPGWLRFFLRPNPFVAWLTPSPPSLCVFGSYLLVCRAPPGPPGPSPRKPCPLFSPPHPPVARPKERNVVPLPAPTPTGVSGAASTHGSRPLSLSPGLSRRGAKT